MDYQQERESVRAGQLILKEVNGELSVSERAELQRWLDKSPENRRAYADLQSGELRSEELEDLRNYDSTESLRNLLPRLSRKPKSRSYKIYVGLAAALLISIIVAIGFYLRNQHTNQEMQLSSKYGGDALPGGNHAILTLADGSTIRLDSLANGARLEQGGTIVTKTSDGQVTYERKADQGSAASNTVATPNGGQYRITLPDGTNVWLNAASSLRYPTAFTGNERRVTLTGEGYFEVTENKEQPFRVESNGQTLEVLGTSFNVNAYTSEPTVTTTLVSGSVNLSATPYGPKQLLKPGEQATMQSKDFLIRQVDVQDYVSWRTGLIVLNNADLPAIIRQVERWYDVEFIMPEVTSSVKVFGELNRDVRLSEILDALNEYYGLTFEIQGRRVIARE